jgi:hypothetical protein
MELKKPTLNPVSFQLKSKLQVKTAVSSSNPDSAEFYTGI